MWPEFWNAETTVRRYSSWGNQLQDLARWRVRPTKIDHRNGACLRFRSTAAYVTILLPRVCVAGAVWFCYILGRAPIPFGTSFPSPLLLSVNQSGLQEVRVDLTGPATGVYVYRTTTPEAQLTDVHLQTRFNLSRYIGQFAESF